jgi:hypothetical protein
MKKSTKKEIKKKRPVYMMGDDPMYDEIDAEWDKVKQSRSKRIFIGKIKEHLEEITKLLEKINDN